MWVKAFLVANVVWFIHSTLFAAAAYHYNLLGQALFFALASFVHFQLIFWCKNKIQLGENKEKKD